MCDGIWIARLLNELGFKIKRPVPYNEDNQSAIKVVEEPRDRSKLKHIEVKHSFVKELVQNGSTVLKYVPSEKREADILTKGLTAGPFHRLRVAIGLSVCID